MRPPRDAAHVAGSALAVAAALILLSVAMVWAVVRLLGGDPQRALAAIHAGSLAYPRSVADTLLRATPLIFVGLGLAVAFRCGIWNIGAEGQLLVGMLASTVTAVWMPPLPPLLAVTLCLLSGAAAGAAWAAVAALLKLKRQVPEVISTIMLNFLAVYLIEYLIRGPMRDPGGVDDVSPLLPAWTRLPRLSHWLGTETVGTGSLFLPNGQPVLAAGIEVRYLHAGVVLALLTAGLVAAWLAWSSAGFRIRVVGQNPDAARAAGLPVKGTLLLAFLASGALAGMAGAVEQLGMISRLHRYAAGEPGYGFSGIAVALLGGLQPFGVVAAALFFGGLRAGCDQMQRSAGVSHHVAYVIEGAVVLLLISVPQLRGRLSSVWSGRRERRSGT